MPLSLYNDMLARKFAALPELASAPREVRRAYTTGGDNYALRIRTAEQRYEIANSLMFPVMQLLAGSVNDQLALYEHMALPADSLWIEFDYYEFNLARLTYGFLRNVDPANTRFGLYVTGAKDSQTAPIRIHSFVMRNNVPVINSEVFELRGDRKKTWDANAILRYEQGLTAAGVVLNGVPAATFYAWGSVCDTARSDAKLKPTTDRLYELGWSYPADHVRYPLQQELAGAQGTLAFALAFLGMVTHKPVLNSATSTSSTTAKYSTGLTKTFSITWDTLDLKLSAASTVSRIKKGTTTRKPMGPKVQHAVREAWAYRRSTLNMTCNHFWEDNGRGSQQVCKHCGSLRWKRSAFIRGDASVGIKHNTHIVVK